MILYANTQPYFLYKASKPLPRGHNGTTGTKSISTTIQDVDLVKLLILYIVFYEYSIHRKYVKILLYFTAVEKHTASPQIMYISKLSSIESTAL